MAPAPALAAARTARAPRKRRAARPLLSIAWPHSAARLRGRETSPPHSSLQRGGGAEARAQRHGGTGSASSRAGDRPHATALRSLPDSAARSATHTTSTPGPRARPATDLAVAAAAADALPRRRTAIIGGSIPRTLLDRIVPAAALARLRARHHLASTAALSRPAATHGLLERSQVDVCGLGLPLFQELIYLQSSDDGLRADQLKERPHGRKPPGSPGLPRWP